MTKGSDKVVVTLRGDSIECEIPENVGKGQNVRKAERSAFGSVRLFNNIPKTITKDELDVIKAAFPTAKIQVRPYVESKRVDVRGASEAEIESAAERAGVAHLSFAKKAEKFGSSSAESKKSKAAPAKVEKAKEEQPKAERKPQK